MYKSFEWVLISVLVCVRVQLLVCVCVCVFIVGDKTRMDQLSKSDDCYVRASPTRGVLGGIAEHTADVITLCEAGAVHKWRTYLWFIFVFIFIDLNVLFVVQYMLVYVDVSSHLHLNVKKYHTSCCTYIIYLAQSCTCLHSINFDSSLFRHFKHSTNNQFKF